MAKDKDTTRLLIEVKNGREVHFHIEGNYDLLSLAIGQALNKNSNFKEMIMKGFAVAMAEKLENGEEPTFESETVGMVGMEIPKDVDMGDLIKKEADKRKPKERIIN